MPKSMSLVSAAATLALSVSAVQAMPLSNNGASVSSPPIILVAGGCGPGFHRNVYGVCRPNGGPVVVVPGPVVPAPYWQGPGWRFYNGCWRGPAGRVHCV